MSSNFKKLTSVLALSTLAHAYTWPSPQLDQLESLLYDQHGWNSQIIASLVTPCSAFSFGPAVVNRSNAADWIRTAYHDMATHNIEDGTGGLDASIQYEMGRAENAGTGFSNTMKFLSIMMTRYVSLSDMIAIGAKVAIEQCSGPKVNFRGGRIDATEANAPGVPEPNQDLESHIASFARQGFNETEMISLVACGHSFGGVQHSAFPDTVPAQSGVSDVQATFDTTPFTFDNNVASEYAHGTTANPLVVGHNDTTNSDKRIFGSDGNVTMNAFESSPELFKSTCGTLFSKMIHTVPANVELTEVIEPLPVKPDLLLLTYMGNGTLRLSGSVRFWNTAESTTRKVGLRWADHAGETSPSYVDVLGHTAPMTATMLYGGETSVTSMWYNIGPLSQNYTALDAAKGISKLWFEVDEAGDGTAVRTEDQGGVGFAVQDSVMVAASSCADDSLVHVDIAVRSDTNASRIYLEYEIVTGSTQFPIEETDVQTAIVVQTVDAQPLNTTTSADGFVLYRADFNFTQAFTSHSPGELNIAAELDGSRLLSGTFDIFSFPVCPS